MKMPLLSVRHLRRSFDISSGFLLRKNLATTLAVDDVSFDIQAGETVGLVGSSGSGKSTLARLILRLIEPDSGEIWFDGEPITTISNNRMRLFRQDMQVVFQDPLQSLNPRRTVAENIALPLRNFGIGAAYARQQAIKLMDTVGLDPAGIDRYPHEFSGGQCQRIAIARALALKPRLLILDEPVSALDVSVQAQIINLLKDLQSSLGMAYLFVSHDMGVVRYLCDRVLVMYRGRLIESGSAEAIHNEPAHPFTRDFLCSVLSIDGDNSWLQVAERVDDSLGSTSTVADDASDTLDAVRTNPNASEDLQPSGGAQTVAYSADSLPDPASSCGYLHSCISRMTLCANQRPPLFQQSADRQVACHLFSHAEKRPVSSPTTSTPGDNIE